MDFFDGASLATGNFFYQQYHSLANVPQVIHRLTLKRHAIKLFLLWKSTNGSRGRGETTGINRLAQRMPRGAME